MTERLPPGWRGALLVNQAQAAVLSEMGLPPLLVSEPVPEGETMTDYFAELRKCRKPDCRRKVKVSVAYCCTACGQADGDRKYEIESYSAGLHWVLCHSADCEQRNAERGEVSVSEL